MNTRRIIWLLLGVVGILLIGVTTFKPSEDVHHEVTRGNDPWIFRSVLDWRARMVTMALRDDFWIAYDAENASIYKAWRDGVEFDGPVFTRAHGPQPISKGPAWFQSPFQDPWILMKNGKVLPHKVQYRGHATHHEEGYIQYELILENGDKIMVKEEPEILIHDDGHLGLERIFTTKNVPSGLEVWVQTHMNSMISEYGYGTDGVFEVDSMASRILPGEAIYMVEGKLKLNANASTTLTTWMHDYPTLTGEDEEVETEEAEHPGKGLIARSDCQTCHNEKEQAIGPAYQAISEKYNFTNYFVSKLANKIINGGSGVWGAAAMTPHIGLQLADAKKMVSYILGLDGETMVQSRAPRGNKNVIGTSIFQQPNPDSAGNGAIVHIHKLNGNTNNLSEVKLGPLPNYVGSVSEINAIGDGSFLSPLEELDVTNDFYAEFKGYLNIDKANNYLFRILSDDGSQLFIDGNLVIDNDGLHGFDPQEAEVTLAEGKHPFTLKYFQAGGGKGVSFQYIKYGSQSYEVVPASMMSYDASMLSKSRKYVDPKKLTKSIPGDKFALKEVHPSFRIDQIRPDGFEPMVGGLDFMSDGKLIVSTWDPNGSVYMLDNVIGQDDPSKIKVKKIAQGLAEPLGLKVVEDTIYILQKQELTKLIDHDGDDIIDEYYTVANSWDVSSNFHEFSFGLVYQDGYFYGALATAIEPGGKSTYPQIQDRGRAVKISRETGKLEFMAYGLRTPNGVGLGIDRDIFICDNQGDWIPASKLVRLEKGAFYGNRSVDFEGTANITPTPPIVWLPQDEIGNSPTQPTYINKGPYKNQMLHGEVTHGGLKRTFVEQVEGVDQGCVFRFSQGFEGGINRAIWGPDGNLYVGEIGNPGNWGQTGKKWYGLQRLVYTGGSTFEMLAVRAKSNGMEIEFTEPLDLKDGFQPEEYEVMQWYYLPTENYGGPKMNPQNLKIKSVKVAQDRKKVFLELDGMKEGHVVYIRLKKPFVSAKGHELWTTEAWYTLNRIPVNKPGFTNSLSAEQLAPNTLSLAEKRAGWQLLFDGKTTNGWKGFKKDVVGSSWKIEEGNLTLQRDPSTNKITDGGEIMTEKEYDNFELSLEWKISTAGNSGIFYLAKEDDNLKEIWHSALEMQVLDNVLHPDGAIEKHRAGDLYDLIQCKFVAVNPPGEWNHIRIIHNEGKLEHWLNGRKVVETDIRSEEWTELVAGSKFNEYPAFGKAEKGHIALQDHSDNVWYRNIKIRPITQE
ncbi:MAG: family 16 glycoside hydrolase [Bacteroidota bacterium]